MSLQGVVEEGFERGVARARQEFYLRLSYDEEELSVTMDYLANVANEWPWDNNDPFVRYVAEIIGVAATVRAANGFPPLTRDQIIAYFAHSADILDSLKHA
jgi:hypothetical protein